MKWTSINASLTLRGFHQRWSMMSGASFITAWESSSQSIMGLNYMI